MGSGTNGDRVNLGSDKEGDTVGTELVKERRQEVHGLEGMNAVDTGVVLVVEGRNDEQDEIHQETDLLHILPSVKLVVNKEGGQVVSTKRDSDIDQVPEPAGHDGCVCGFNNLDEIRLEELVAIEEDVVTEPGSSCGKKTTSEVLDAEVKRLHVVSGDLSLLLIDVELSACQWHLVPTVVDKPESTNSGDCE